jgi:hypothetical protein
MLVRMCKVSEFKTRIRPHSASQLFFDDVHEPGLAVASGVEGSYRQVADWSER